MEMVKINGVEIFQPDENMGCTFQTTYSEDSTRVQNGALHLTPMFTVEQISYSATDIPTDKAAEILQMIIKGQKFILHYYSLYYNAWRDAEFYVGQGQFSIGSLSEDNMHLDSLSFNMTGVNPL